ncbi:uncharacterized protein LODBEIA_P12600 [Lodderomyces beijingensis]|uniref:Uncharacterized protein n=1 Tax=Lodderomyces beijingensis TaxID=1775926 RepID=A0ABP0ZJJ9_9ASCO
MIAIPSPLKKLFDSLPLYTIHNEPLNSQPDNFFSFKVEGSSPLKVVLGVYNTFQYKEYVLPTDPRSLSAAIILAKKNSFGLPSSVNSGGASGIAKIPFRGSFDSSLPILIGDSNNRTIESGGKIAQSIAANNITSVDLEFINEYVESTLFDLWIVCLLVEEIDFNVYRDIFGIMDPLELMDLKSEMTKWNNFSTRHKSLFESFQKPLALKNFYDVQLSQLTNSLTALEDILDSVSGEEAIVAYKFASFVVIVDQFLKSTRVGMVLAANPLLIEKCYGVCLN